jgi:hypothetical protein
VLAPAVGSSSAGDAVMLVDDVYGNEVGEELSCDGGREGKGGKSQVDQAVSDQG